LVAWIPIGKDTIFGINGGKKHPKFKRQYDDQTPIVSKNNLKCVDYKPHAEARAILSAIQKGYSLKGKDLYVTRFSRSAGDLRGSRPCFHCMELIKEHGIRRIFYTDSEGVWWKEKVQR